jgi:phytoene dehydrogenase-like protein
MAAASPFFEELELTRHGVEFVHSPYPLVHPLDGGGQAILERSVEATAARLGPDEEAWLRVMKPLARDFETLKRFMFYPVTKPPLNAPLAAMNFGLKALQSAFWFAEETFETEEAKALLAGCAAHSFSALTAPLTNTFGIMLAVSGQVLGWPLVRGGSQKLIDALVTILEQHGGTLERGRPISTLRELPPSRVVLFDTHAHVMERICGDALPWWYRKLLAGVKLSGGVFKLDYALSGPMPWTSEASRHAATVHLGGTMKEVAESEARLARGEAPEHPYVLVAQQSLFDDTRAPTGQHTLWAYCHVPNGSDLDATAQIEAQLERFAPGFQKLVLARTAKRTSDMEAGNAAYVGGDISGGAMEGLQALFRPAPGFFHASPNPKLILCSSSAPPGPGVHGMSGYWGAQVALQRLR